MAVYGGLALAAYGEPRETKDADFAVASVNTEIAMNALSRAGLAPSLSFEHSIGSIARGCCDSENLR